jgi:hypothetical protein
MIKRSLGAVGLAAALTGSVIGQVTWYVDDENCPGPGIGTPGDPFCTIQAAIDAALDGDEVLVAPGTYLESINYLGLAIAVRSTGGPAVTAIDAGGLDTVVRCVTGEGPGTILEGFTITGGSAAAGAGLRCVASTPTVVGCVFLENHVTNDGVGGAMFLTGMSSVTVVDTDFLGNTANVGAGIFSEVVSDVAVSGCTFRGNVSAVGSAINARELGTISVADSRFIDNGSAGAVGGGAIGAFDSDLTVIRSLFTGNQGAAGGAIVAGIGTLAVRDSVFVNNLGGYAGGAIYELNLASSLVNCLFSSNQSTFGGGVFTSTETFTATNCTFVNNFGSGFTEEVPSVPVLTNCIFRGNTPAQLDTEPPGSPDFASAFYCNVEDGFAGPGANNIDADPHFVGGPSGQWTGAGVFHDPTGETTFFDATASFVPGELVGKLLVPLTVANVERPIVANTATTITVLGDVAVWGVPGLDYHVNDFRLTAGSPSVDAADNTAVPGDVTTDLDGLPRFLDVPETPDTGNGAVPIVDMGAYEALGDGCLAITNLETICHGDGIYFTVNVEGLNACTGGTTMATFTGSGGAVGADFCATLIVNTESGGFCCSTQVCVPVPDCAPLPPPCDVDGDFVVGVLDFLAMLSAWGPNEGHPADLDGDGEVGVADFLILLANWGPCP